MAGVRGWGEGTRERDELCCFEAACVIQDKGIRRQRQRREKGEEKRANTEQMALSPKWRNCVKSCIFSVKAKYEFI